MVLSLHDASLLAWQAHYITLWLLKHRGALCESLHLFPCGILIGRRYSV